MIYITTALNFLNLHTKLLVTAMLATYGAYVVVNMMFGMYRQHNRALIASIAKLRHTATTGKVVPFVASVPLVYRGQWHCYTTAHSVPAVSMFTPIAATSRCRAKLLLWCSIVLALLTSSVLARDPYNTLAMYSLCVFVIAQWPIHALLHTVRTKQYSRACRIFGRWVSLVQAYFGTGDTACIQPAQPKDIEDMIQQLQLVKKCDKSVVADKVASILGNQPQNVERTVSQQRRINNVLNELIVTGNTPANCG